jgi:hypothetical protein
VLFSAAFGFTTSAGALYQAHWVGLAVTGAAGHVVPLRHGGCPLWRVLAVTTCAACGVCTVAGLGLTTLSLAWGATDRRGYGPAVLVLTTSPLLLASPTVALLEDFGWAHRQLQTLQGQVLMLTVAGEGALLSAVGWNSSWDVTIPRRLRRLCSWFRPDAAANAGSAGAEAATPLVADQQPQQPCCHAHEDRPNDLRMATL